MTWNISEAVYQLANSEMGDRPALIHGDDIISYRSLCERATGIASWLQSLPLSKGAHVGHYMRNSNAYMETMTAAGLTGMTHVNVNYRYVEQELIDLCDTLDIQVLVYDTEFADRVANIKDRLTKTTAFIEAGTDSPANSFAQSLTQLYTHAASDFERRCSSDDLIIIATGGTTGLPKGVMWRHEDIWRKQNLSTANAMLALDLKEHPATIEEHVANVLKLPPAKPFMPLSPLMHGAGMLMSILMIAQGIPIITVPGRKLEADLTMDMIKKYEVGGMALVGDAFAMPLIECMDRRADENLMSGVAMLVSTGASLSEDSTASLRQHAPNMFLMDTLGSSEASGFAVSTSDPGVFKPLPTTCVLDDQMQEVTPGSDTIGIAYSGGYIPMGYYNQPEKSAETFVEHNGIRYVMTGDRCTVREDGMLVLLGRDSNVINSGGEKVYTVEVERALLTHPSVSDALVVGLPHPRFGKMVVAVVEGPMLTQETLDVADIQKHLSEQLADYKIPRSIYAIDAMKRADNGKADYRYVTEFAEKMAAGD